MEDWVLATLLIVYCIVQGQSYTVTNATVEKLVTAPTPIGSDSNYSTIDPNQIQKPFKPSKQLFSTILLPIGRPEQPQRYDKVYQQTEITAPISETRKDQLKNTEEILYGFPTELKEYDEEGIQQSIEVYPKSNGEIAYKPFAHKDQSFSEAVVTYNNHIPYSLEKTSINSLSNKQKRKEIHYHQHKHLHDHDHKQDHVHKHRQEHVHDHGHTHQDNNKHGHYHVGQHGHHHIDEHYHTQEGSHHHEHQSAHQHEHQQEHKHDHQHQQKQDQRDKHNHEHNNNGERYHDHHGSRGHVRGLTIK